MKIILAISAALLCIGTEVQSSTFTYKELHAEAKNQALRWCCRGEDTQETCTPGKKYGKTFLGVVSHVGGTARCCSHKAGAIRSGREYGDGDLQVKCTGEKWQWTGIESTDEAAKRIALITSVIPQSFGKIDVKPTDSS